MLGIDEAQMQRLENETERLTKDIKQKEEENEMLRGQISSLKTQVDQSKKMVEEVAQVSDVASHYARQQFSSTNASE
jgi:SMC interacting uncharacterized protein involved in chromosome segregation